MKIEVAPGVLVRVAHRSHSRTPARDVGSVETVVSFKRVTVVTRTAAGDLRVRHPDDLVIVTEPAVVRDRPWRPFVTNDDIRKAKVHLTREDNPVARTALAGCGMVLHIGVIWLPGLIPKFLAPGSAKLVCRRCFKLL